MDSVRQRIKHAVRSKCVHNLGIKNRFLELFSRPMDEGPDFVDETFDSNGPGAIESATGNRGGLYERFDLVLPVDASVARLADKSIEIRTNKLRMRFVPTFDAMMTVLPRGFTEYYIHAEAPFDVREYAVRVDVEVCFTLSAFLSARG